jgi:outer membrane protein assembly factor BamB
MALQPFRLLACALAMALLSLAPRLATAASVAGEDWPQFLGPRANGTSLETGLLTTLPKEGPKQLWSLKVGTGYSAPSVLGARLVLHHRIGKEEVVECFNAATGTANWRYAYPCNYTDPYGYNNGPRCSPLLTTNRCYTFGVEGKLLCLDLATGKMVWERDTAKDWQIPEAFFGVGSTPILEDNLLIVMVGGQPNSGMVAFDATTGKTVWESVGAKNWNEQPMFDWPGERLVRWVSYEKQASYATPVAATVHGKRTVFALTRQGLISLDPKTGEVNFSRWFRSALNDSVNAANPVVVDDLVFISGAYSRIGSVVLRVKPDGKSFEQVWRHPREEQGRPPQLPELRVTPALEIHWTTPIYHEGNLYAFSGRNEPDARFRCVELKTGKVLWDRDESWGKGGSGKQPNVFGRGSAIMAEGKLIVLGEGGLLGLVKVNPEKLEEISRWQVPELHYPCWTAPVLSRKRLYLRSEDHLICYDFSAK